MQTYENIIRCQQQVLDALRAVLPAATDEQLGNLCDAINDLIVARFDEHHSDYDHGSRRDR